MSSNQPLSSIIDEFDKLTTHPENYLSVQDEISEPIRHLTKSIYDFTKKEEKKLEAPNALPKLIVDSFDEEQIWQEIELQNEDRWTHLLENVSKFINNQNDFIIPVLIKNSNESVTEDEDDNIDDSNKENGTIGSDYDSDVEAEQEEESVNSVIKKVKKQSSYNVKASKSKVKGSIVDDEFFKLNEMEEFLDTQDKAEMMKDKKSKKRSRADSSESEDEDEEINLFDNWDSDEDDDVEGNDNPKYYKYDDFFDGQADSEGSKNIQQRLNKRKLNINTDDMDDDDEMDEMEFNDNESEEIDLQDNNGGNQKKKVRFSEPQPSSSDDDSNAEDDMAKNKKELGSLSEFQLRQQRLSKKIGHLEDDLLKDKSWPMKGEVDAVSRPQNSLLEEVVDFDIMSRPAPVITEETTLKLEDIIRQRIKDKSWDDVERKLKPVQDIPEFKKQLVLDQEKSKLSLAQVYEKDFIKQRDALDPNAEEKPEEEPAEHIEIRSMLTKLFTKLDALCNFHYTPKIIVPEIKIISNIPAINMEEVAPVATTDATLLAPEEVKAKPRGDIIGKSERTDTDKKRERRQKKMRQREKEKEKEKRTKLVEKLRPGLGNKYSKEKVSKLLEKVTKDRNVDKMIVSQDKKSYTSSTAFFNQLQDEVKNTIKSTISNSKPNKGKKNLSAKRLKL